MLDEKYILAELKRWLVDNDDYMSSKTVLRQIAKIEADAVLGIPADVPVWHPGTTETDDNDNLVWHPGKTEVE